MQVPAKERKSLPHKPRGTGIRVFMRLAGLSALAGLIISTTLGAQQGRHLSASSEPLVAGNKDVVGKKTASQVVFHGARDLSLLAASASDLTGVASAVTTEYRYDDGTAEAYTYVESAYEQEYVQRFQLPRAGTIAYVAACFGREQSDNDPGVSFNLLFYANAGNGTRPGREFAAYTTTVTGLARNEETCIYVNSGDIVRRRLGSGTLWVGIRWANSTGKLLAEDRNGPGGTRNFWRYRTSAGGAWSSWNLDTEVTAYFIRLAIDHGGSTPPPPTTGCQPTTPVLLFDGGYTVSMCYRTPKGEVGQAKSGIWASSQSGLLWFFDRENAEVLVKVLDGCSINGYRWVYVAPVTDLEFNFRITAPNGKRWAYGNRQGRTAPTKSDIQAFRCADEFNGA